MTPFQARVRRGAALLDRVAPGWRAKVRPDILVMAQCHRCVLGQVYGEYWRGIQALGLNGYGPRENTWAAYHGFWVRNSGGYLKPWAVLSDLWREELAREPRPE